MVRPTKRSPLKTGIMTLTSVSNAAICLIDQFAVTPMVTAAQSFSEETV
jgi:hypothetical protein